MAKKTTTRTFRPSETPFVLALLLLATRIATSHAFFVDSWSNIRSSNTRNSNIGKPCNDQRLPQRLAWYQRNSCSLPVAPLYSADSDDDSHQQYDNGDAYDSQTHTSLSTIFSIQEGVHLVIGDQERSHFATLSFYLWVYGWIEPNGVGRAIHFEGSQRAGEPEILPCTMIIGKGDGLILPFSELKTSIVQPVESIMNGMTVRHNDSIKAFCAYQ
jgi:hypothetical protein